MSKVPELLDLAEGGGLFREEMAENWIQLVGGEVTLQLIWTGDVPVLLRRIPIPSLMSLVKLQVWWGEVGLSSLGVSG